MCVYEEIRGEGGGGGGGLLDKKKKKKQEQGIKPMKPFIQPIIRLYVPEWKSMKKTRKKRKNYDRRKSN